VSLFDEVSHSESRAILNSTFSSRPLRYAAVLAAVLAAAMATHAQGLNPGAALNASAITQSSFGGINDEADNTTKGIGIYPDPPVAATTAAAPAPAPGMFLTMPSVKDSDPYVPITGNQRVEWIVDSTLGPTSLLGGIFSAGIGTGLDRPKEYGPHWDGFADRYGMRLTGVYTGNVIEAGFGAMWGEDPRYFRAGEGSIGHRIGHIVKLTFLARYSDGHYGPAYARYIGITGNNFMSNTWRQPSEANDEDSMLRTLEGFGGRMAGNAFAEFWPDISTHVFHRH
jgi:hypothetical protein